MKKLANSEKEKIHLSTNG